MSDTRTAPPANGELVNRIKGLRLDDQLGKGSSGGGSGRAGWLGWILCAALAVTWAGVGIRSYRKAAEDATTTGEVAPTTNTSTSTKPGEPVIAGTIQIEVKGYIVPAQLIAVSPIDVGGRVVELNVIEGKLFKKGDVLARLEDISYKAMVEEAKASLAAANQRLEAAKQKRAGMMPESVRKVEVAQMTAELKEAEAMAAQALDQLTRLEKLGIGVSEQEVRKARFDSQAMDARVRRLSAGLDLLIEGPRQQQKAAAEAEAMAAEAEVKAAEARLIASQWRLNNCVITAPITGTVLTKKAELGNLVNPMAFSASTSGGGAVCDLADLANLEVELKVPEKEIAKVKTGQKCRIKSDAYPDKPYFGFLDRIMPIANRGDGTVNVRVKVLLPPGEVPGTFLKPDMGALVSFLADTPG